MNAAFGYAIATVARSQLAGIAVGVGLFFAEGIAGLFLPDVFKWFPFSAVVRGDAGERRCRRCGGGGASAIVDPARPEHGDHRGHRVARRRAGRDGRVHRAGGDRRLTVSPAGRPGARRPPGERDEVGRGELDLEAAPAGRDVDRRPCGGALVERRGQRPPGPQRRDPAEDVAGRPLRLRGRRDRRLAPAERVRDGLEVHLPVRRDDGDPEPAVDRHDDRLEHARGVDPEGRDGLERIPAAAVLQRGAGVVRIFMHRNT